MKKLIFVISLIAVSGFLFGLTTPDAKATTTAELQVLIQQLQEQIVTLQQQLPQIQEETCHTSPLWSWDYCSPTCQCYAGEGDCDTDADCYTGYCARNVGAKYGQPSTMDVCEKKAEKSITVISPNGGETWTIGSSYTVRWTSSNLPKEAQDSISISLYPKGYSPGDKVAVSLVGSAPNTGSYNGIVPDDPSLPSGQYKIKVGYFPAGDAYGPGHAEDMSDNYFSIVAAKGFCGDVNASGKINIGDVVLLRNYIAYPEQYPISSKWAADVNCDGAINVLDAVLLQNYVGYPGKYVLHCCGGTCGDVNGNGIVNIGDVILCYNHVKNPIMYPFSNPWAADVNCDKKIDTNDYNLIMNYVSYPGKYQLNCCSKKSITVISPNGGEKWVKGQTYEIQWKSAGIEKVVIMLLTYNAEKKQVPFPSEEYYIAREAEKGSYNWAIPAGIDFDIYPYYKILIEDFSYFGRPEATRDISDNYFSITKGKTCHTSPLWSWDYCSPSCQCYAREGDCDTDADCTTGYCAQNVGAKYGQVSTMDVCEEKAEKSITVISPNGGEKWAIGNTYTIKWNTTWDSSKTVSIGLIDTRYSSEIGPRGEARIVKLLANPGSWNWTIPEALGTMDLTVTDLAVYKIKIYVDGGGEGKFDDSDAPFSIVKSGCHTSPLWSWDYCSPSCQCYAGEGDCDTDADCTTGYCAYNVGTKYGQVSTMDVCEQKTEKSITVISPNGGERWVIGNTYEIKWKTSGITSGELIFIGLYDGKYQVGHDVIIPGSYTTNTGSYYWNIPQTVDQNSLYKIEVWIKGAEIRDMSDNYFSIVKSDCHTSPLWSWDYCSPGCKCYAGEGDCDTDSDCYTGYCAQNVGTKYGQVSTMDVCEKTENHPPQIGLITAPISVKVGESFSVTLKATDPDNDNLTWSINWGDGLEMIGLCPAGTPGTTFQAGHNYQKSGDYTVKATVTDCRGGEDSTTFVIKVVSTTCHTSPLWSWDYCSPTCQCLAGEGDCDTGSDCYTGYCAQNVGAKYGQVSTMDVCEKAATTTTCKDSDGGKDYFIKGITTRCETGGTAEIGGININTQCIEVTDTCVDSTVLKEYFCENGLIKSVSYTCSYGCKDGACQAGITVISPNGGEKWTIGKTYDINWASEGTNYSTVLVNIYLWRDGEFVKTIALGVSPSLLGGSPSIGKYSWTVPSGLTAGDKYQIKLYASGIAKSDFSDNYFSIVAPEVAEPSITITAPIEGEKIAGGTKYTVNWKTKGLKENHSIYLYHKLAGEEGKYSPVLPYTATSYSWEVPYVQEATDAVIWLLIGETGVSGWVASDYRVVRIIRMPDVEEKSSSYILIENQLASLTEAVSKLMEQVKNLMGR